MRSPCLDKRICKGVCSHLNGFWRQCFGVNGENYLKLLCESMHLKSTLKPFSAFSIVYERLISHRIKIRFTLIWLGRQQLPHSNNYQTVLQMTVLSISSCCAVLCDCWNVVAGEITAYRTYLAGKKSHPNEVIKRVAIYLLIFVRLHFRYALQWTQHNLCVFKICGICN